MKCARRHDRTISLHTYSREHYQFLHDEGKKGHLFCPYCGQPVFFRLNIHEEPAFIHKHMSQQELCEQAEEQEDQKKHAEQKESASYKELGGFRFPTGKQIISQTNESYDWQEPKSIQFSDAIHLEENEQAHTIDLFPHITFSTPQLQAVTHKDGPMLVLAGAGSGKTRVLTARAAYLMSHHHIPAHHILLVTFTTKASSEMKERLRKQYQLHPSQASQVVTGTFHSLFYKMLLHDDANKWNGQHLIKFDWQKEQYIRKAIMNEGLDEKNYPTDQVLQSIGFWKNAFLPGELPDLKDEKEKHMWTIYQSYEQQKQDNQQFDFDDMAIACLHMLTEQPELLKRYQERFKYILVDEFQDINPVQYQLIQLLAGETEQLFCVGDDDQAIYAFRGSNPAFILEFKRDYPSAQIVHLHANYRSHHTIVASADAIIKKNQHRYEKTLKAVRSETIPPTLFYPYDEEEEATMIVADIQEKIKNGAKPSDICVLFRTNTGGRAIYERLHQSAIPYETESGVKAFYSRRIVRVLLAFLSLSQDADDVAAMKQLLPVFFLKQQTLNTMKALTITEDCSMVDALGKLTDIQPFQQKKLQSIVPLFRTLRNLKPSDAVAFIEQKMGLGDYLKKRVNDTNVLEKGADDVRDVKTAAKRFETIEAFLAHAEHMKSAEKEKTDEPGVQLMTIHRAKGLEFQTVYITCVVDGALPHDFSLDELRNGEEEALEEERRLLYVAMTRAEQSLYLSVPSFRRGKTAHRSRFLYPLLKKNRELFAEKQQAPL
ncbi:ATP-dependent helicase [Bacillus pumilus]|uniref:UvrD-helicase domain-containing protein n=1 Tax=Bacillus pumilus TaxID=1408 RepID=UPI00017A5E55|nr:ATP-dependent helicase [Bacillus pumilus]EDW23612.1 YjcD [Bacillus pumilus ATCC 7061]MCR4354804.1 ATP-dependent helicase [Bacillus pumilus]MCY7504545.1 ATP-dependent helicase [Bacillus pumilus]MDR4271315.1 ATP-dependent helicase [Bacillus pumilus]MED4628954.1 ATP-dependent helicase [Bacillus pumilus]